MDNNTAHRLLHRMIDEGHHTSVEWSTTIGPVTPEFGQHPVPPTRLLAAYNDMLDTIRSTSRNLWNPGVHAYDNPNSTTVVFLDIDGVVSPNPYQEPHYHYSLPAPWSMIDRMAPTTWDVVHWLRSHHNCHLVSSSSWGDLSTGFFHNLGGGPETYVVDQYGNMSKKESVEQWLTDHPQVTTAVLCEDNPYPVEVDNVTTYYIAPETHTGLTSLLLTDIDRICAGEDLAQYRAISNPNDTGDTLFTNDW